MEPFLEEFFPDVHRKMKSAHQNEYCRFDSQLLTLFTSSLYLAALVSSLFASTITRVFGRKWSMFLGGFTFFVGSAFNGFAQNIAMLLIGRILLGFGVGVGFANQVSFKTFSCVTWQRSNPVWVVVLIGFVFCFSLFRFISRKWLLRI